MVRRLPACLRACLVFLGDHGDDHASVRANLGGRTAIANQTEEASYPGCRSALEVFFCSQQPIYREDSEVASKCSVYRRPDHENVHRCLAFCPAIRDSCPLIASTYCEDRCRTTLANDYCRVLEITGLDAGRFPVETLDMMNKFRIEAEADEPLLRDGRPAYRSIPARRPSRFGGRSTKLDYFLYSTRIRGFNEWLLDTNDIDTDGAVAHASDSNILPYMINSDCTPPPPVHMRPRLTPRHIHTAET